MIKLKRFQSNVQYIKYLVNKAVAEHFLQGSLENSVVFCRDLAEQIVPGPKASSRCCIYKERHIIEERIQLLLHEAEEKHIIHVLDAACEECPIDRFVITEACRGCLGHKCQQVCPKNAIYVVNQRAYINQNLCIECGRCKQACSFNAISEVMRPCIRSCAVGAITVNESRRTTINQDKCISCGACVYQCPFGAIVDRSFLLETLQLLKDSWNNTNYHVYAVLSATVASQFPDVKMGQAFAALKELGFFDVVEAAIGADMVMLAELDHIDQAIETKGWETTSYCPSFVTYIQKNYPQLMDHVSPIVSPMIAIASAIREKDPKAKVVYITSCIAKKSEIQQKDLQDIVDCVLTFEELHALFDAKNIVLTDLEEIHAGFPSSYGRICGKLGGFSESIRQIAAQQNNHTEIQSFVCSGMDACIKTIQLASFGKLQNYFIEGMVCKDGCTVGMTSSLFHDMEDIECINRFSNIASTNDPKVGIQDFHIENIKMNRTFPDSVT